MATATVPNGFTVYQGPSQINGQPIKAVVTGTSKATANPKTGDMLQLWILPANEAPHHAIKSGADASVCGECPARPINGGDCYVTTFQAPLSVWRSTYPNTPADRNVPIRLGAYGDPAALPFDIVAGLIQGKKHTGYTHQWRTCDPRFKSIVMASVDSDAEAAEAKANGWRYFRVEREDGTPKAGEVSCPASEEAGKRTTCANCLMCSGTTSQAKSIVINAH